VSDDTRLAATLRLINDAGRALSSSFDFTRTIGDVGHLLVPAFAAGFAVDLTRDDGSVATIVRIGSIDRGDRSELVAHGRPVGMLTITGVHHDAVDRDLIDELSTRIAIAIDSARTYDRENRFAGDMQLALLPDRLPVHPQLTFDAAYIPGAEEAFVGGDWYDAFALPDGRLAMSMGDVCGNGKKAALIMGEVRNAFRTAALDCDDPVRVLERANTIVGMRPDAVMVTGLFGIIDPDTHILTYAVAGHPPPIIAFADGGSLQLPGRGLPLGIDPSTGSRAWTITLPPGSLLACYTDGLIETTRDVIAGEAWLHEALRAELVERSAAPARSLVRRALAGAPNADDIAALLVRTDAEMPDRFAFAMTAIPTFAPIARRTLQRYMQATGPSDEAAFAVITAASEALANAVEHAFPDEPGLVTLCVRREQHKLVVTVEDDGAWKPAERREERGRGMQLMRAVMDTVEISTRDGRTLVTLSLAVP
jgi:serine/threonine-protein kinase RsbW